jgi:hypothetical protein
VMNEDWDVVMSFFPKNWRWLAKRTKVLKGLRKDKDPEQLLRSLLIHFGCGYSLRETSVRIRQEGIADLSDVALLKRLRKSKDWLHGLCVSLLREGMKPGKQIGGHEFRLFDSTTIKEQGKTGSLWRIHYSMRVPSLQCDFFRLTPAKGKGNGDSLLQYPADEGDYIIADRGYCHSKGLHYASSQGAYVCVRVNQHNLRLCSPNGNDFSLLSELERALKCAGRIGEWDVLHHGEDGACITGRICAIRKSVEATQKAIEKSKRKALKEGRKVRKETLQAAKYIILFTTFPKNEFSAESVLEGYRFRWQIELIFKRFKQLAQLGHLPKKDKVSVEAWLYGKLFVALLTQRIVDHANSFSPWGYDLEKIPGKKQLERV